MLHRRCENEKALPILIYFAPLQFTRREGAFEAAWRDTQKKNAGVEVLVCREIRARGERDRERRDPHEAQLVALCELLERHRHPFTILGQLPTLLKVRAFGAHPHPIIISAPTQELNCSGNSEAEYKELASSVDSVRITTECWSSADLHCFHSASLPHLLLSFLRFLPSFPTSAPFTFPHSIMPHPRTSMACLFTTTSSTQVNALLHHNPTTTVIKYNICGTPASTSSQG